MSGCKDTICDALEIVLILGLSLSALTAWIAYVMWLLKAVS